MSSHFSAAFLKGRALAWNQIISDVHSPSDLIHHISFHIGEILVSVAKVVKLWVIRSKEAPQTSLVSNKDFLYLHFWVLPERKRESCQAPCFASVPLLQVTCYLILSQFGFGIVTLEDQQTSGCIYPSLCILTHPLVNVIAIIYNRHCFFTF